MHYGFQLNLQPLFCSSSDTLLWDCPIRETQIICVISNCCVELNNLDLAKLISIHCVPTVPYQFTLDRWIRLERLFLSFNIFMQTQEKSHSIFTSAQRLYMENLIITHTILLQTDLILVRGWHADEWRDQMKLQRLLGALEWNEHASVLRFSLSTCRSFWLLSPHEAECGRSAEHLAGCTRVCSECAHTQVRPWGWTHLGLNTCSPYSGGSVPRFSTAVLCLKNILQFKECNGYLPVLFSGSSENRTLN